MVLLHALLALWLALHNLGPTDFWDEKFNVENVLSILGTGELRPANAFYGPVSYWPQTALLAAMDRLAAASGVELLAVRQADGALSAPARMAARLVSLLWGSLAIVWTARLARRLFSPAVGLTAAAVLAGSPWAIRGLVDFKPDSLLLFATLLALGWLLDAVERPGTGRFALAGAGVGLAAAAKLNGVFLAPVFLLGVVLARPAAGWLRRVRWLLLGGLAAAGVYLALSPWVGDTLSHLERNVRHYRGGGAAMGRGELVWALLGDLAAPEFHGPLLGGVAYLGILLGLLAVARRRIGRERLGLALPFFAFPVVYLLLYVASTTYYKQNNFLQLLPFTAVAVAATARAIGARAGRRAAAGAMAAVAAVALAQGVHWTYAAVVPTTGERVARILRDRLEPLAPRLGIFAGDEEAAPWAWRYRSSDGTMEFVSWRPVEVPGAVPDAELDLADCELLPLAAGSVELPAARRRRELVTWAGGEALLVAPRWLEARGSARYWLLLHPWRQRGEAALLALAPGGGAGELAATLPADWPAGEIVSLDVAAADVAGLELDLAGRRLRLWPSAHRRGVDIEATTERLTLTAPGLGLRLRWPGAGGAPPASEIELRARRWEPAR